MKIPGLPIEIRSNVYYAQAYGCRYFLQVGSLALYIGNYRGFATRLELFTHSRWFRFSRGRADR